MWIASRSGDCRDQFLGRPVLAMALISMALLGCGDAAETASGGGPESESESDDSGDSASIIDPAPTADIPYILATSAALVRIDRFAGESEPPLVLFDTEPDVKLNIAVDIGEVIWVEQARLVQAGRPTGIPTGRLSLELAGRSEELARDVLESLSSRDVPVYATLSVIPPLPNNPDGGLEIQSVLGGSKDRVEFVYPAEPSLNSDLAAVAQALGRPASIDLLVDWAKELSANRASADVGPIQAVYRERIRSKLADARPTWASVDPKKRAFDDMTNPPPAEISERLRDITVSIVVPEASKAAAGNAAVAVRTPTANVHLALLSVGSHSSPARTLPDESIEVWVLPDGPLGDEAVDVSAVEGGTVNSNGGLTITLTKETGEWVGSIEPCAGTAEECSRVAIAAVVATGAD